MLSVLCLLRKILNHYVTVICVYASLSLVLWRTSFALVSCVIQILSSNRWHELCVQLPFLRTYHICDQFSGLWEGFFSCSLPLSILYLWKQRRMVLEKKVRIVFFQWSFASWYCRCDLSDTTILGIQALNPSWDDPPPPPQLPLGHWIEWLHVEVAPEMHVDFSSYPTPNPSLNHWELKCIDDLKFNFK